MTSTKEKEIKKRYCENENCKKVCSVQYYNRLIKKWLCERCSDIEEKKHE